MTSTMVCDDDDDVSKKMNKDEFDTWFLCIYFSLNGDTLYYVVTLYHVLAVI